VATKFYLFIYFYFKDLKKNKKKNKNLGVGSATPLGHMGVGGHPHFGQGGG
jgi:hypothetical protein